MMRYLVGLLLAMGLIVVVIILVIRGFGSSPQPLDLNSYAASNTTVQFTIDSPVSAASTHHDVIINVGNTQSTVTITEGYAGQLVTSKSYQMNVSGYAVFLHALTLNGFTKGNKDPNVGDERGQCALGDRFKYEVIDGNGNDIERYWFTSCNFGTFQGNVPNVRQLFILQVPDFYALTATIQL